jgi:hypothetical protein
VGPALSPAGTGYESDASIQRAHDREQYRSVEARTYCGRIAAPIPASGQLASLFGLSEAQALVVLFVFLPLALAAVVFPLVAWRSSGTPRPTLTSEILATGVPGEAEILATKVFGSIIDFRPMVRFRLMVRVGGDEPFELEVFQSLPRGVVHALRPGDLVEVRVTPDRAAGAIVWGMTGVTGQPGR